MSWVDNLPANLELLTLLSVSSVSVTNVAVAPPIVFDPVVPPVGLPKSEHAAYARSIKQARRERAKGCPSSSTRGGKKRGVAREDILSALEGANDLSNFFVLAFTGLLKSGSTAEYARLVYAEGIEQGNSFTSVTMDDFTPVFVCVFNDLIKPCTRSGKPRTNIGTRNGLARALNCSTAKAGRLLECYKDAADIVMASARDVSFLLHRRLNQAA